MVWLTQLQELFLATESVLNSGPHCGTRGPGGRVVY